MTTTTTAINAKNVVIFLDDDAGMPINVSGSTNRVSIKMSQDLGEYAVFEDAWQHRLSGMKDGEITLRAVYSTAVDEALDVLREWIFGSGSGTPRTLKVCVPNNSPGSKSYTAEVLPASLPLDLDSSQAGPVMVEVELRTDGSIAVAAIT